MNKLLLSLLTFVIPYVYQYLRPTMDVFYTFGRAPLPPNALGYADPKPQPEVIDLTDDAPAVKQEPAAPAPAPMVADDEEQYTCPISMELMKDPVMADDGHMYDLEFLVKWFATTPASTVKSPKTNEPMTKGCVRPWAFHKAYAAWAAATGHPAPVAAGTYGRVVVAAPVQASVPVLPWVTGAAMRGIAPAPRVLEVSLNCSNEPNIQLRVPVSLAATMVPVYPLSDRVLRWGTEGARSILKANFPGIAIRTDYDLKGALKSIIRSTPNGADLWRMISVTRRILFVGDLRVSMTLSVEEFINIRGSLTTIPETLKRLTLPMLKEVAMRYAPQLVPSMSTKARSVQLLTAHFTPLCTPVPAQ